MDDLYMNTSKRNRPIRGNTELAAVWCCGELCMWAQSTLLHSTVHACRERGEVHPQAISLMLVHEGKRDRLLVWQVSTPWVAVSSTEVEGCTSAPLATTETGIEKEHCAFIAVREDTVPT